MWLLSRPTVAIWDGEGGGPGGYTARGLAAGVSIQACLIKAESCFLMLEFVKAVSESSAAPACDTSTAPAVDVAAALTKAAAASRSAS